MCFSEQLVGGFTCRFLLRQAARLGRPQRARGPRECSAGWAFSPSWAPWFRVGSPGPVHLCARQVRVHLKGPASSKSSCVPLLSELPSEATPAGPGLRVTSSCLPGGHWRTSPGLGLHRREFPAAS